VPGPGAERQGHPACGRRCAALSGSPLTPVVRVVTNLYIELDPLTSMERRDLANALLRAAWSATLTETRILLLDLLIEADESTVDGDEG
jgi:hypothetical protein